MRVALQPLNLSGVIWNASPDQRHFALLHSAVGRGPGDAVFRTALPDCSPLALPEILEPLERGPHFAFTPSFALVAFDNPMRCYAFVLFQQPMSILISASKAMPFK
jgi:hypothetical protein